MFKIKLPSFAEKDEINLLRAELIVAKAFATAATAASGLHDNCVRLEFDCPITDLEVGTVPDQARSRRALRDAFSLLVDRALTRVYPPIDVLQYLSESSPHFSWNGSFRVVFFVKSTRLFCSNFPYWPQLSKPYAITYTVEGGAGNFFEIESNPEKHLNRLEKEVLLRRDQHQDDLELWRRAKKSRARTRIVNVGQKRSSNVDPDVFSNASKSSGSKDADHGEAIPFSVEKIMKFHKKASIWLSERILNEASWAKPSGSLALMSTRYRKRSRQGTDRNRIEMSYSANCSYPSVLAAAAASLSSSASKEHISGLKNVRAHAIQRAQETGPQLSSKCSFTFDWMVHQDVRGIEFEAVVVAWTSRYAYVACPCCEGSVEVSNGSDISTKPRQADDVSRSKPTNWCLVSRIPIPSFLVDLMEDANHAAKSGAKGRLGNPPTSRDGFLKELNASGQSVEFLQLEEATRFDNSGPFLQLREDMRRLVTIRAHGVRCRRMCDSLSGSCAFMHNGSPLLVWFEDVYLLDQGIFLPSQFRNRETVCSANESSEIVSGILCSELMGLVETSCRRYLAISRKMSDYAHGDSKGKGPQSAAEHGPSEAMETVERYAESEKVCSLESVMKLRQHQRLRQAKHRLAAKADAMFYSMTDTRSVYYKKSRKSLYPLPLVRTTRDVQGLFEGPAVEFKHHINPYVPASKERFNNVSESVQSKLGTIDMERIRNTITAMASTMGGIVCVGVTDQGEVVGHKRGEVVRFLRTTGFCPAMVKESVVVRELPIVTRAPSASSSNPDIAVRSCLKTMPKDWWKIPSTSALVANSNESSVAPQRASEIATRDVLCKASVGVSLELAKVVTVITVSKGSAPFYTPGRAVVPYLRGCASTVRMPTLVLAQRLAEQFEGDLTEDS